jgi:hypothetical protein
MQIDLDQSSFPMKIVFLDDGMPMKIHGRSYASPFRKDAAAYVHGVALSKTQIELLIGDKPVDDMDSSYHEPAALPPYRVEFA